VSGLYPAASLPTDQAEALVTDCVNAMINCFGPDRLLYGGDWPISTLHAEIGNDLALNAIRRLPADVRESLTAKTATRLYLTR
jgi:L-fuconolactonase